jgi:hypothetical protein
MTQELNKQEVSETQRLQFDDVRRRPEVPTSPWLENASNEIARVNKGWSEA